MNSMLPNSLSSWLIYIVVALLLGAIGTGLWESILKPLVTMTAKFTLKVISLGMKSAQKKSLSKYLSDPLIEQIYLLLVYYV